MIVSLVLATDTPGTSRMDGLTGSSSVGHRRAPNVELQSISRKITACSVSLSGRSREKRDHRDCWQEYGWESGSSQSLGPRHR